MRRSEHTAQPRTYYRGDHTFSCKHRSRGGEGVGATLSGGGRPREDAHGYPRTAIMCRNGETVGLGGPAGRKKLHVRS